MSKGSSLSRRDVQLRHNVAVLTGRKYQLGLQETSRNAIYLRAYQIPEHGANVDSPDTDILTIGAGLGSIYRFYEMH
mgnify:CR=1 FL=1